MATFWHTITGSLLAMYWRLRGFPAGEDPHATVRQMHRRPQAPDGAEESGLNDRVSHTAPPVLPATMAYS